MMARAFSKCAVLALLYLMCSSMGCNTRSAVDAQDVVVDEAVVDADGWCRLSIMITNTSSAPLQLLRVRRQIPELDVRYYYSSGRELTVFAPGRNRLDEQESELVDIKKGSSYIYKCLHYLGGCDNDDELFVHVKSPICSDKTISKKILKLNSKDTAQVKGLSPLPRMSAEEIAKAKSALAGRKRAIKSGKERRVLPENARSSNWIQREHLL